MRFDYTTPESETKTINAFEVTSFAVDIERTEAHVSYQLGNWDGTSFTILFNDQIATVPAAQFATVFTRADEIQTNNPGTTVQQAILYSLHEKLGQYLGKAGSVTV